MISRLQRFWAAALLTLGLVILANLGGLEATPDVENPVELPLEQARILAQRFSSALIVQAPKAPEFSIPIDCSLGEDCFILLYPDRDPSPDAVDFGCGRQTYDGHKGTDFAVSDEVVMAQGVPVLAAAPGRVLRVRDGVPDRRLESIEEKADVAGQECGNGVVIDHSPISNGLDWETQYCHLRQNSVVVKPGETVERGAVLGFVGTSGATSFPHVHLSFRYQGQVVDPFVGPDKKSGCQVNRNALWDRSLPYTPTGLIRAGFSTTAPTMNQLWEGEFKETTLPIDSPALIFWVQLYGVFQGDQVAYKLIDPQGRAVVDQQDVLQSSTKTYFQFLGRKNNPQTPFKPGTWRGEYRLTRDGEVLVDVEQEVQLVGDGEVSQKKKGAWVMTLLWILIGLLLFGLSIPLILGNIPPNHWYGF
ncbi:MAG: M23 family metallopeptidase, partial [Microcoleaceae cyanobacterium]